MTKKTEATADDVTRAVLAVLEAGPLNSEQHKAVLAVRVLIGDSSAPDCAHEYTAYDAADVRYCTVCGDKTETTE